MVYQQVHLTGRWREKDTGLTHFIPHVKAHLLIESSSQSQMGHTVDVKGLANVEPKEMIHSAFGPHFQEKITVEDRMSDSFETYSWNNIAPKFIQSSEYDRKNFPNDFQSVWYFFNYVAVVLKWFEDCRMEINNVGATSIKSNELRNINTVRSESMNITILQGNKR